MVDGPQNDVQTFERAVIETLERLDEDDRVLVHCSAGASQSPAVAAKALALDTAIRSGIPSVISTEKPSSRPADLNLSS